MRRVKLTGAMFLVLVALASCATFETNTYKTFGVLAVSYDTSMQALGDLKKQGKISDAEWAKIDEYGRQFYVSYNASMDAFQIYLTTKDKPSQEKLSAILAETSLKLSKITEYYNIWKGGKK